MVIEQFDFTSAETAAADFRWKDVRLELNKIEQKLFCYMPKHSHKHKKLSLTRQLNAWKLRSSEYWWQDLHLYGLKLRRTQASDTEFYRDCFANKDFSSRYNRQNPWTGDINRALLLTGQKSPVDLGAIHWIVCTTQNKQLGLASLTSLNFNNSRAEVSIGFPHSQPPMHAVKLMLLLYNFSFFKVRLNKLSAYIYTSNKEALHNAIRMGLKHEGTLKDHFFLPPGEFVDVNVLGITRKQLLNDNRLLKMAQRFNLDWKTT